MHVIGHLLLSSDQLWTAIIGAIVPLGAYIVNRLIPGVSEPIKAAVHVVLAVIAGALYTALATHVFGLNTATLQLVVTAVLGALIAHHWLWKPSTISDKLRTPSPGQKTVLSD